MGSPFAVLAVLLTKGASLAARTFRPRLLRRFAAPELSLHCNLPADGESFIQVVATKRVAAVLSFRLKTIDNILGTCYDN